MARRDRRASPLVDSLAVGFRRGSRRFDAPGDRSILRYVSSLNKTNRSDQSEARLWESRCSSMIVARLASICLIEVIGQLCLVTRCGAGLLDGIIICRRVGCPASLSPADEFQAKKRPASRQRIHSQRCWAPIGSRLRRFVARNSRDTGCSTSFQSS
jgi:hypothetical protein